MNRFLNGAALVAGLAAALWVALTHAGSHPAVLPMLLLIVAAFLTGAAELRRYAQHTAELRAALNAASTEPPADIQAWLNGLPDELRGAVRLRLQGDRAALPGPAMTPYLTGLLVLLGLLGTFIGMVATLGGTVSALSSSADLQTVRAALASPVQGLGLAFGTSVAGVAASAALGLMAALARGERTQASRELDSELAGALHRHTEDHRRRALLQALQAGAEQLQSLPAALERGLRESAQQMQGHLREQAEQTHALLGQAIGSLRDQHAVVMVDQSSEVQAALRQSLERSESALVAASSRVAEAAAHSAQRTEHALSSSAQHTQSELLRSAQQTLALLAETAQRTQDALAQSAQATDHTLTAAAQRTQGALAASVKATQDALAASAKGTQDALAALAKGTQQALAASSQETQSALALSAQQTQDAMSAAAQHTSQAVVNRTGEGLEQFLARFEQQTSQWLTQAAHDQAQAQGGLTTAAAEAITALRQQTAESAARDREQLAERERLLGAVDTLMQALQHAATEQAQALDGLLASAADKLDRSAVQFDAQAAQVAQNLALATEQAGASSQTLAQVGASFAQTLEGFGRTNAELGEQLARVEAALGQHLARSDEQLAYYVAQAREVIELTLGAQERLLQDLRKVSRVAADNSGLVSPA